MSSKGIPCCVTVLGGTGGSVTTPTWATVLAAGAASGGTDPVISTGDTLTGETALPLHALLGDITLTVGTPVGAVSGFDILVTAGDAGAGGGLGGNIIHTAGNSVGAFPGGSIAHAAGDAGTIGPGGALAFDAGDGGTVSGDGGPARFAGGNAGPGSDGGAVTVSAGDGDGAGNGADTIIESGEAGSSGDAGDVLVRGRQAGFPNGDGSNVFLIPTDSNGTGTQGAAFVGSRTIVTNITDFGPDVTLLATATESIDGKEFLIRQLAAGSGITLTPTAFKVEIAASASADRPHWASDDTGFILTNSATYATLFTTGASDMLDGERWELIASCEAAHPVGSSSINLIILVQVETAAGVWTEVFELETNPQLTPIVSDASEPQCKGKLMDIIFDNAAVRMRARLTAASGASSSISDFNVFAVKIEDSPP